jgi:hypothetical protein
VAPSLRLLAERRCGPTGARSAITARPAAAASPTRAGRCRTERHKLCRLHRPGQTQSGEYASCPRARPSPDEADQVIDSLKNSGFGVGHVCRVLCRSESAYYARKKRPKCARRLRDEQLMRLIEQVHAKSGGTYGARQITRAPCGARASLRPAAPLHPHHLQPHLLRTSQKGTTMIAL